MTKRVYERIVGQLAQSPDGMTATQIALRLAHPVTAVKSALGALRLQGRCRIIRFIRTGSHGGSTGVWGPCAPEDKDGERIFKELMPHEGPREAAKWAALMRGQRYEDRTNAGPLNVPRVMYPEPRTSISCTAAMCAHVA